MDEKRETETSKKESPFYGINEKTKGTLTLVFAIIIGIFAYYLAGSFNNLAGFGYFGAFLIGLISSATVILPTPGALSLLVFGNLANPILVGILFGIGSAIGELTGYMAGMGGNELIHSKIPGFGKNLKTVKKYGPVGIFFFALIPNPAFDLAGIAAGLIRMNVWLFLISCAAGKIVKGIIIAYLGMAWL